MWKTSLSLLCCLACPLGAQVVPAPPGLDAEDAAHRAERLALTGDLGMAPLPPLTADSPLDTIVFADRVPVLNPSGPSGAAPLRPGSSPLLPLLPAMVQQLLPNVASTGKPEIFYYQLPLPSSTFGKPMPLVVGYHGYGASAASVANWTTLDEQAALRGWAYMAPTGLDDKLFGSLPCQDHIEAAIQWMLDSFDIDPERIYMVGFSMGAGVCANFASRRRDPDDMMIAAVGCISGTLDWTMTWNMGTTTLQAWLENSYNFGDTPQNEPFHYQQCSGLSFDQSSYTPQQPATLPGAVNDPLLSMASNLEWVPSYMTWDLGDPIAQVPVAMPALVSLLASQGTVSQTVIVSGSPQPHSWAILDEQELCDFFQGIAVDRHPASFDAMQDLGGPVSWAATTQLTPKSFTYLDGVADPANGSLLISNAQNAAEVEVDGGEGGVGGPSPVQITAFSTDGAGFSLRSTGFATPPSYLLDTTSGALITLVDSDPATGSLLVDIPGFATLDVNVVSDPDWTGVLTTAPNPAPLQSALHIDAQLSSGNAAAWLIVAVSEALYTVKGVTLTALAVPPALLIPLALGADGHIEIDTSVPNDTALQGLRFPLQALGLDSAGQGQAVSNLWGLGVL